MIASINFFPNVSKMNQRTHLLPIYMRVTFQRRKTECRLNVVIHEKDVPKWDPITQRMQERNSAVNHFLNRLDEKFTHFLVTNSTCLPQFSAIDIKCHILGMDDSKGQISLMNFVDDYFEKNVLNNANCRQGTVKNYRRAINHLKAYLAHNKEQGMSIGKLNVLVWRRSIIHTTLIIIY